jgi:hypothetical protein
VHDFRFPPEDDADPAKYWGNLAWWLLAAGFIVVICALVWLAP